MTSYVRAEDEVEVKLKQQPGQDKYTGAMEDVGKGLSSTVGLWCLDAAADDNGG